MNSVTKKKIWRENVSLSTRIFFGIWIFVEYLRVAASFIFLMLFLTNNKLVQEVWRQKLGVSGAHYTYDVVHIGISDLYYAIGNEKAVHNLMVFAFFLILVYNLAKTLWLHIGKSRVISVLGVVACIQYLLATIVSILDSRLHTVLGIGVCIALFLIGIVLLFISIGILKATFKFHYLMKKEIQNQDRKSQPVKGEYEVKEPYFITKPRLQESIYSASTDKNVNVEVIHIDSKHKIDAQSNGKSVYGGTLEKRNASNTNQEPKDTEAVDKKQQDKARIRIERDEGTLGKDPNEQMYRMEKRPLLSGIKKTNEGKAANQEKDEELIEPAMLEEVKEEIEPAVFEEKEEPAESVMKEPIMEELQDGVKLDTSLGYRRITFDDL